MMKGKRKREDNKNEKRKRSYKLPKLDIMTYSFNFERANNNDNSYPPSLIPIEIWKAHILPWLANDFPQLRLTCRAFMFLVSSLWKNKARTSLLASANFSGLWRAWLDIPQWPFRLHTLVIENTKYIPPSTVKGEKKQGMSLLIARLAPLNPTVLRFEKIVHPLSETQECINNFPNLQRLWAHDTSFTQSLLESLPATVHTLFFFCGWSGDWKSEKDALDFKKKILSLPANIRKLGLFYDANSEPHVNGGLTARLAFNEPPPPLSTGLQSLYIYNCKGITDETVSELPTTLTSLTLRHCHRVSNRVFNILPPALECFNFHSFGLSDFGRLVCKPCDNLRELQLRYSIVRNNGSVVKDFLSLTKSLRECFPKLEKLVLLPPESPLLDAMLIYQSINNMYQTPSHGNILPFIKKHENDLLKFLKEIEKANDDVH